MRDFKYLDLHLQDIAYNVAYDLADEENSFPQLPEFLKKCKYGELVPTDIHQFSQKMGLVVGSIEELEEFLEVIIHHQEKFNGNLPW